MWEIKSCQLLDECYPKVLRDLPSAPKVLYYVGDISLCQKSTVAVIGKRNAAERYCRIAYKVGEILAQSGYTVLNGLAVGIDTEALKGAVNSCGKVIAVMPGGLDIVYPQSNRQLAETIVTTGGCLISEYPIGTRPQKHMFIQRDRIQAMLSSKIFIIDAETTGGTMHTAEFATKYAKPMGCFMETSGRTSPSGNQLLVEQNRASMVYDTKSLMDFIVSEDQDLYMQMSLFECL